VTTSVRKRRSLTGPSYRARRAAGRSLTQPLRAGKGS
jgi:hypothetical protein